MGLKLKHSGSTPRNACVACETQLCVTTKKVSLLDRHTDRGGTKWSLCAAMLHRRHKYRHDFAKWWKKLKLRMCQLGRGSGGRLGPQKLWGKWCKILHSRHFQTLKITWGKHDFLYQIITLWNNYYLTQRYEFPLSLLPFCFIDT